MFFSLEHTGIDAAHRSSIAEASDLSYGFPFPINLNTYDLSYGFPFPFAIYCVTCYDT